MCNFGKRHYGEHLCEIILIWTSCPGDVFFYFYFKFLSGHFVLLCRTVYAISLEGIMSNFIRGHYEEHLRNYLNFGHEQMSFKDFSIFSSGSHFVKQSGTISATLVKGIIEIICVKLF